MKKTLLAVSIASLFAGAAVNATTIYEEDGLIIGIKSDIEVVLLGDTTGPGAGEDRDSGYMDLQDADFGIDTTYDLGNKWTVLGAIGITGEDEQQVDLDIAYIGFKHDVAGTLTFGRQTTIMDDAGVGYDMQFGFNTFVDDMDLKSDQVVKYKFDNDTFYAGVAYMFNQDKESGVRGADNAGHGVDGNVGVRFAGFDMAIYAGKYKADNKKEVTAGEFQVIYTINESFEISAFYAAAITDNENGDAISKNNAYGFAGQYKLNAWTFAVGAGMVDDKKDKKDKKDNGDHVASYINAAYAFNDAMSVYTELGYVSYDESKADKARDAGFGYAAGVKIKF
ncbi:MAG TPA: porin [Psychromonas hadalis]|nr:porin [Psychromonas hadalis]